MNKKIWIAIIVVALLITVAIAWTISKKSKTIISQKTDIIKISDQKMLWPKITSDQKTVYYFSNEKEPAFFKLDLSTKEIKQISDVIDTPGNVIWSPDFSKVILLITYDKYVFEKYGSTYAKPGTPDQSKTIWAYDFQTKKLNQLNSDITNIAWFDNDHLVYSFINVKKPSLNKALFDGEESQELLNLQDLFVEKFIKVSDNQLFFIGTNPEESRNLYQYIIDEKEPTLKIKDVGDNVLISSDNTKVILEQSENNQTTLYWSEINNPSIKNTNIQSGINQTVWVNQDQFLINLKKNGVDILYLYNTLTDKKSELKLDLRKTLVDDNSLQIIDQNLYFTSKDILYKITLSNI